VVFAAGSARDSLAAFTVAAKPPDITEANSMKSCKKKQKKTGKSFGKWTPKAAGMKPELNSWRPDWRDPSSYPFRKDTSSLRLTWEFVRRSPEYQKDFLKWDGLPFGVGLSNADGGLLKLKMQKLQRRWKMGGLVDPRTSYDRKVGREFRTQGFFLPTNVALYDPAITQPTTRPVTLQPGEALAIFSLQYNIGKQLDHLKVVLEQSRKQFLQNGGEDLHSSPKTNRDMLGRYLRILDGEYAGASALDMGIKIFGNDRGEPDPDHRTKIEQNLERAKQLANGKYDELLLTAKPKEFKPT
jgi:hypothetical protein